MIRVTEKYKYLEAKSIVKDNFYSQETKDKYQKVIDSYLKNKS